MVLEFERNLAQIRSNLSGEMLLALLAEVPKLLINLPLGFGKSHSIDSVVKEAIYSGAYDFVIVLTATRAIINERKWVIQPPSDVFVLNIQPRPQIQCGSLNATWSNYESRNLGLLARKNLCGVCQNAPTCFWLEQYNHGIKSADVIYATQTHYENDSEIITQWATLAQAQRTLILIDESNFLLASQKVLITHQELQNFTDVVTKATAMRKATRRNLLAFCRSLILAATSDLRDLTAWQMPQLLPGEILFLQELGEKLYCNHFKYIGNTLRSFAKSPIQSREKTQAGDLSFAPKLVVPGDCIIYSGTTTPPLLNYRLDSDFVAPFSEVAQLIHPQTEWFNIAYTLASKTHFLKNMDQILGFFAQLILQRYREGKRVLLVSKKDFVGICEMKLNGIIKTIAPKSNLVVVAQNVDACAAQPPTKTLVPLINYGVIGINLFEYYECCYCLNSYFVNESVVNSTLQDMYASDYQIPIKVEHTRDEPKRRIAKVANSKDRYFDVSHMAQAAFEHQEIGVVMQAIGRVRPMTKPREIITQQCSSVPLLKNGYTAEFSNLEGIRQHFGIKPWITRKTELQREQIQKLKSRGLSSQQIAKKLNISKRTAQRYCHKEKNK